MDPPSTDDLRHWGAQLTNGEAVRERWRIGAVEASNRHLAPTPARFLATTENSETRDIVPTRCVINGWRISGAFLAKTGFPFTVITGSDGPGSGNVDGSNGDRPNLLDPSILGRTIGDPNTSRTLLRRSAFGYIAPTDSRGSLGFNTFRRGGIRNMNAALARSWKLRSEWQATFRVESINLFNTPQFANPNPDLSSPAFGKITNTLNDGRSFQFTLQLQF